MSLKKKSILLIAILIIISPPAAYPEYNRATEEEELIFVSTEQEVAMGKKLARNVEKKFKLEEDILLQNEIKAIGAKLVKVCDRRDIGYHFGVLLGEELKPEQRINAFALPGGYIYIFKDLLGKLEGDDEIAAILAHEVGHIAAKHSIKRLQGSYGATLLQILAARAEGDNQTKARAQGAIGLLMMNYSREDEFLADKLSAKYLKAAGYDPEGAIRVIDMMIENQKKEPIRRYTSFRSHPYLAERRAMIRKEIYGQISFDDYINLPE